MSCQMFVNGSFLCSKNIINETQLCSEHQCKKIITEQCNICLSNMTNEYVFILCGHSFHKECIGEWLIKNRTCPCCRQIVKTSTNHDEINNSLSDIHSQINDYGVIVMSIEFIDWIFEMIRIYVDDISDISLFDILCIIQQPDNLNYFMTLYSNELNSISIDVFELELKLNRLVNILRQYDQMNILNDSENQNINVNELIFEEFQ